MDHHVLLVESLMGLSQCCGKAGLESDAIRILKKALEYSWLRGLQQQQLRIFDQIGKMHYHLGDVQKARQYHSRHINAMHQPASSALRLLSKQRILKSQQIHLEMKYGEISRLLLVHLKVPIRNIEEMPVPYEAEAFPQSIRKNFDNNNKFLGGESSASEIKKILQGWFFRQQIEDPNLPQDNWNSTNKHKKFAFLDFQLNQQLKRLQGVSGKDKKLRKSAFPVKQSLEEQISRKMKQPPLESDWYEKIVKQINRDHRNKLLNVRNAVRIRGFNKKIIPSIDVLKDLYNSLYERSKAFTNMMNNSIHRESS